MPDLNFDPSNSDFVLFVAEFEVEHEDVFHLKNLYKLIYEWLIMHDFYSSDSNSKKDDKIENFYWQRILQNGNSEHHIWWRTHHIPRNNNYYKYFLKFDFQTLNMGKTEVMVRGKKMSTNSGDVILRCKAYVMLDYKREWRDHPFLKHVHRWFLKYYYKKHVDFLKTELWVTTYKLQDTIKQYLSMKTPYEMPDPYHPERGV